MRKTNSRKCTIQRRGTTATTKRQEKGKEGRKMGQQEELKKPQIYQSL